MNATLDSSSAIQSASYDVATRKLTIVFRDSGTSFTYADVDQEVYEALLTADSAGRFFNAEIRNQYAYTVK